MMHAQNAALFLGQIPNPHTGEGEVNLDLARLFIDQLSMIQEKTRGNLSTEEATVLRNTLTNLQMAFVEVSQSGAGASAAKRPAATGPTKRRQGGIADSSTRERASLSDSSSGRAHRRR